jgi:hypothetical protein
MRRITVPSQPRQIVQETLSRETFYKNRAGRLAQGESPEFKPQYCKKKKKKITGTISLCIADHHSIPFQ